MRVTRWFAVSVLVSLIAACSDPAGPSGSPPKITALPRTLSASEQAAIGASNEFGFALLRQLDETRRDDNIFMSPLSASMALGMVMNGASGNTLDEMRATLAFGQLPMGEINASYRSVIDLLRGLDRKVDFRIANAIFHSPVFTARPEFLTAVQNAFDAKVDGKNFTVKAINDWVNASTNGKIPTLIDQIDPTTVMILLNAIYFKGDWTEGFDRSATRSDQFTTSDGSRVTVPMMQREGAASTAITADAEVVDLPYGGQAFSMTILLPREGRSVNDLIAALTPATWGSLTAQLAEGEVQLTMPKFRLEWEALLNDELKALGMRDAFQPYTADFSALSDDETYISWVKQKTFVDVNEVGTEAAAVTGVGVDVVCVCGPREIRIDRPFVFAIRERLSGTILFVGKIANPLATE